MAEAFKDWVDQVQEAMTSVKAHNEFTYLNYAAPAQNPLASYGDVNVQFLKNVATKYDPEGVFQRLMPGGFKISKANVK